jgi:hypothetical protein
MLGRQIIDLIVLPSICLNAIMRVQKASNEALDLVVVLPRVSLCTHQSLGARPKCRAE